MMMIMMLLTSMKLTKMINMMLLTALMLLTVMIMASSMTQMSKTLYMDTLAMSMLTMTIIITLLILTHNQKSKHNMLIMMITMMSSTTFLVSNTITFYMTFELTMIPTIMLILTKGKQPERIQATTYLLLYTVLASLPLLITLTLMSPTYHFTMMYALNTKKNIMLPFMLAFLVKCPMFMLHSWLPKAHVEAPTEGSMILAAILLKLGGYGLLRVMPLNNNPNTMTTLTTMTLCGTMMTSTLCIRQKDMKMIIAYSSVAHMSLMVASTSTQMPMMNTSAILMMVSHGLISSALFLMVHLNYTKTHTRNTFMYKGMINISMPTAMWWYLTTTVNMAIPPFLNILAETSLLMNTTQWSLMSITMTIPASLLTTTFSINLYITMNHNNPNPSKPMSPMKIMNHMSLMMHVFPLTLLMLKSNIMHYQQSNQL